MEKKTVSKLEKNTVSNFRWKRIRLANNIKRGKGISDDVSGRGEILATDALSPTTPPEATSCATRLHQKLHLVLQDYTRSYILCYKTTPEATSCATRLHQKLHLVLQCYKTTPEATSCATIIKKFNQEKNSYTEKT